jgi:hypothetical protein
LAVILNNKGIASCCRFELVQSSLNHLKLSKKDIMISLSDGGAAPTSPCGWGGRRPLKCKYLRRRPVLPPVPVPLFSFYFSSSKTKK